MDELIGNKCIDNNNVTTNFNTYILELSRNNFIFIQGLQSQKEYFIIAIIYISIILQQNFVVLKMYIKILLLFKLYYNISVFKIYQYFLSYML